MWTRDKTPRTENDKLVNDLDSMVSQLKANPYSVIVKVDPKILDAEKPYSQNTQEGNTSYDSKSA